MPRPSPAPLTLADAATRVSEREFMATVIAYARAKGWLVYHPWRSDHSEAGFPDLTLVHPATGRVVFAELKAERGKLTAAQERWRDAILACPGASWHLWRSSDWDEIEKELA